MLGVQVTADIQRLVNESGGVLVLVPVGASNSGPDMHRAMQAKADELGSGKGWSYNGPQGAWPRRVLSGWRLEFRPDASPRWRGSEGVI